MKKELKIKQLEWEEWNEYKNEWDGYAPVGTYRIEPTGDRFKVFLIDGLVTYRNSLSEAKAAAQANFERRVMECLDYD